MNFLEKLALLEKAQPLLRRKKRMSSGLGGVTGGISAPAAGGPGFKELTPSPGLGVTAPGGAAPQPLRTPSGSTGGSGGGYVAPSSGGSTYKSKYTDQDFGKIVDYYKGVAAKNPNMFSSLKGQELGIAQKYFPEAAAARQAYGVPISLNLGIARHESKPGITSGLAKDTGNIWGVKQYIKGTTPWSHGASKMDIGLGEMKPGSTVHYQRPPTASPHNWYGSFITNQRYGPSVRAGGDLKTMATGIQRAGYTSDKNWGSGVAKQGLPFKSLDDAFVANPYKG